MKDGANNYWLSKVCSDHFGPLEQILKDGAELKHSGRPSLGFSLLLTCDGLQVFNVVSESAAANAEIRNGDYLLSLNGQRINTRPELAELLTQEKAKSATLAIRRAGKILSVEINLTDVPILKPTSPWSDAYSRRNYQLGITISQFRTLAYPDQKEWPNAYAVCTDEAKSHTFPFLGELLLSDDWKKAGVVQCSFFYDSNVTNRPESAALMLGDIASVTKFFFISENEQQEPRLFLVQSGGPTENFEDLVGSFTVALAKPPEIKLEPFQTKAGGAFQNVKAIWGNASCSMELRRFGETTQILQVTHVLKPLAAVFEKKLAEGQSIKAKKL
jgi:hypothetical protein